MADHYLIEAANEIISITGSSFEPPPQEVAKALVRGCKTLRLLKADGEFQEDVAALAAVDSEHAQLRQQILGDIRHFTRGFLQIEERVLLNAGLDKTPTSYLLKRARDLHSACNGQLAAMDPLEVVNGIQLLEKAVCRIAAELETLLKRGQKGLVRKALEGVTLGVGGGAIIFTNASAAAASLGLSAAGSAVSAALGGALIKESTSHLRS